MIPHTDLAPSGIPAGYPRHREEYLGLADGRQVFLRPLVPADATVLAFELEHADPETLYNRFFRPSIRVDAALLEYLTVLDYRYRFALVAFALDGSAAGIARYEGAPNSDSAEIAVAVKPAWRQVGLGTALLKRLEEHAAESGIEVLRAEFLASNGPARGLIQRAGFCDPVFEHGVGSVAHQVRGSALPQ
ncbi:MAG: GNAT family N-acetyltransferase [Acidimicrobiia bacterium]|nr:GNAT family N-acetyltransferase [Acidimicrobiia bacterium]MBT8215618.1 GNAT family N-acetyltransferase [Acidimicrobiia bacterium]NNF10799.1 GNAT family N-acetyltransferase [Acidimicrobiia bacterium]NNL68328.1 GNAT family N-acetyltransferase [Acidimicrobiia bacterium]